MTPPPPTGIQPAPDDLARFAETAGVTPLTLDLTRVDGRAELMSALARDLRLPAYFGRNWDALYDLLTDPDATPPAAVHLLGWPDFQARHPQLAQALHDTLTDAQTSNAETGRALWVLA